MLIGHLVENVDEHRQTVNLSSITAHGYDTVPIILTAPNTQSNNDNYPIPRVRNVTTTSFEISVCLDDGNSTCGHPTPEDIAVVVVDPDKVACSEYIDAGTQTVTTNGGNTPLTYNKTFANMPYIFASAQTNNQGNHIAANVWVDDMTTTQANLIGCVHQGIGNNCTS